jgi:hypothetical protein
LPISLSGAALEAVATRADDFDPAFFAELFEAALDVFACQRASFDPRDPMTSKRYSSSRKMFRIASTTPVPLSPRLACVSAIWVRARFC